MKEKLAIILGHSRMGDRGARSAGSEMWEFDFWDRKILGKLMQRLPSDTFYVRSIPRESYTASTTWLANELKKEQVMVAVETHFNAFNGIVDGYEAVYWHKSTEGKKLATCLVDAQESMELIDAPNRGIKSRDSGGRGSQYLKKTHCPAVIWEPFFGDNPKEWEHYSTEEGQEQLIDILVTALINYKPGLFPQPNDSVSVTLDEPEVEPLTIPERVALLEEFVENYKQGLRDAAP